MTDKFSYYDDGSGWRGVDYYKNQSGGKPSALEDNLNILKINIGRLEYSDDFEEQVRNLVDFKFKGVDTVILEEKRSGYYQLYFNHDLSPVFHIEVDEYGEIEVEMEKVTSGDNLDIDVNELLGLKKRGY